MSPSKRHFLTRKWLSEPKQVIWYQAEHWPLPEEVVTDNATWLQQFIGPGAFYLIPAPNYRSAAVIIDRLLMVWFALTAISVAGLIWNFSRHGSVSIRINVK